MDQGLLKPLLDNLAPCLNAYLNSIGRNESKDQGLLKPLLDNLAPCLNAYLNSIGRNESKDQGQWTKD